MAAPFDVHTIVDEEFHLIPPLLVQRLAFFMSHWKSQWTVQMWLTAGTLCFCILPYWWLAVICTLLSYAVDLCRRYIKLAFTLVHIVAIHYIIRHVRVIHPTLYKMVYAMHRLAPYFDHLVDAEGGRSEIVHADNDIMILHYTCPPLDTIIWKYTVSTGVVSRICANADIRYRRICGDHSLTLTKANSRLHGGEQPEVLDYVFPQGGFRLTRHLGQITDYQIYGDVADHHTMAPFPLVNHRIPLSYLPQARARWKQCLTDPIHEILPTDLWHLVLDYFQFMPEFPTEYDYLLTN
jgi:hypothetical protein